MSYAACNAIGAISSQVRSMTTREAQGLLEEIVQDPSVASKLSPVTKALVGLAIDQLDDLIASQTSGSSSFSETIPLLDDALQTAAQSIAGVSVVVQWFMSILVPLLSAASKTRAEAEAKVEKFYVEGCSSFAKLTPVSSGIGNQVRPADLFVRSDGYGLVMPSIGFALAALTEPPLVGAWGDMRSPKGGAAPGLVAAKKLQSPSTGLSSNEQQYFYKLRLAIQDAYKQGDGGLSIWPLYVDMLRNVIKDGKLGGRRGVVQMDLNYASSLINYAYMISNVDASDNMALATSAMIQSGQFSAETIWAFSDRKSCFPVWGTSLAQGVLSVADQADRFFSPTYDKDKRRLKDVAESVNRAAAAVAAAAAAAGPRPLKATHRESFPAALAAALVLVGIGGAAAYRRQRYGRIL